MIGFFSAFVKITGYPVQKLIFRTKVYYEEKAVQSRNIKGPAIIISNHTSVYDYAVFLFVFFFRTLRYQMAEVLFRKRLLGLFLRAMGGIYVDRKNYDSSFLAKSQRILEKGGVVGIFPESRVPNKGEETPLKFTPSATWLALRAGVKVIPVYTSGGYFGKRRARVLIGKPIDVAEYYDETLTEKENLERITDILRSEIVRLGKMLNEKSKPTVR